MPPKNMYEETIELLSGLEKVDQVKHLKALVDVIYKSGVCDGMEKALKIIKED